MQIKMKETPKKRIRDLSEGAVFITSLGAIFMKADQESTRNYCLELEDDDYYCVQLRTSALQALDGGMTVEEISGSFVVGAE